MSRKKRRRKGSGRRKSTRSSTTAATAETRLSAAEAEGQPGHDAEAKARARDPHDDDTDRKLDEEARLADRAEPSGSPRDAAPAVEPTVVSPLAPRSVAGVMPRSMRVTLYASVGAAVVSAAMALFVVTRGDEPTERPGLVRTASAATTVPDGIAVNEPPKSAADDRTDEATLADAPVTALAWPDLALGQLPPAGAAPPELGQSVGSPRDGALLSPTRLPNGRAYVIRDEHTAWGTSNTIEHLRAVIRTLRTRHPQAHRVIIGDISTRRGGPLPGHTSHQSGRDVDIGLMLRGRSDDAAAEFVEATRDNLDRRITYDLIEALAATRDDPTGVELIVLDYGLQRLLRNAAAARGVPEETLEAVFQFPHGPTSRHGLVRHKPAHRDHMHVRFRCPEDDRYCREPLIGFAGMEAPEPTGRGPV